VSDALGRRYRRTLAALARHCDGTGRSAAFAEDIVAAGEAARAWSAARDPAEAQRRDEAGCRRAARAQANAARRLAAFLRNHPQRAGPALGAAPLATKAEGGAIPLRTVAERDSALDPFAIGRGSPPDVMARLLDPWADRLAADADGGSALARPAFMHPFRIGPLLYPRRIDAHRARPDAAVNGLLFHAVMLAREHTSGGGFAILPGMEMPRVGRPLWDVAAVVVGDALGKQLDEKQAQDRMRVLLARNPGLQWIGWPDLDAWRRK
jgi:hypothetical protein